MKEDIFDKKYIESIGFKLDKDDGQYGKATRIKDGGMTLIRWNRQGPTQTYLGKRFEKKAASFSIHKDGDTRMAFNGHIFSRKDIETLFKLTD